MNTQPSLIHPVIERTLRQIILKDLANKGRPQWDKPHTETVVRWMKHFLSQPSFKRLNPKVMITAAYAHDWGYANLFDQATPITIAQSISQKDLHMKRGAEKIERLLYQRLSSYFADSEILRVYDLVAIHDNLKSLQDEDELLLMECDTLGMLDVEYVSPTLSREDNQHFMKHSIYQRRLPLFIHQEAQQEAEKLIAKRERWYKVV